MLRKYYDKILFGLSLLVLIGFSLVFFQSGEEIASEFDAELPPVRNVREYELTQAESIDVEVPDWGPPPRQSSGVDWVYDIFTPPRIFYDEANDRFIPRPPGPQDPEDVVAEVEFVGFEDEPYRIQLTGYVGGEEDPSIIFDNLETDQGIVTKRNREEPQADMEVREFTVHRIEEDGVVSRVAEAVIYDRRTGEEVVLVEEETKYRDEPAIALRTNENPPRQINAREGESFNVREYTYQLEDYSDDPPEITITKTGPDQGEPQRRTLVPGDRF